MEQKNDVEKALMPVDFEFLANQSFWLETLYLAKNTDLQTEIWSRKGSEMSPNIVSGGNTPVDVMSCTWHDIKACHSTHGIAWYHFTFRHLGTNEVKGKIRFDLFNFVTRFIDGEPDYDLSRLRNAAEYWNFENSNCCTLSVCPIANFYSFKRMWLPEEQILALPEEGAPTPITSAGFRENKEPFHIDTSYQGAIHAVLDEAIIYGPQFPNELPIFVFLKIDYTPTFLKSHMEPIGAGALPGIPADG